MERSNHIIKDVVAHLKCVTGYAEMSNDLTDCLDFDYQQTRDRLIGWLIFFFNVSFSLFLENCLLDFEMGKVKVFFYFLCFIFVIFRLEILLIFLFFIFYALFLLFFVLEILLIFLFFIL